MPQTAKSTRTTFDTKQADQDDDQIPAAIGAVEACATRQLMQDTLETYYVPLEVWYMRTSVDKASLF